jgi:hypothetical protein
MKIRGIRLQDGAQAETLGVGSAVAMRIPPIARKLGTVSSVSGEPIRWRHARVSASGIDGWLAFEGTEEAGPTPAEYTDAAVFTFPRASIDIARARYGAQHAVAYVLGETAVMLGTAGDEGLFRVNRENPGYYDVAMRIGQGTLQALPGVRYESGCFSPVRCENITFERMPAANVDPAIPIV